MKLLGLLLVVSIYLFANSVEGFLGTKEVVSEQDEYDYILLSPNQKNVASDRKELIVLKYLNFDYNTINVDEKIIISFDIDTEKNITNILFKKKSSNEKLNKALESAIRTSANELPRPEVISEYLLYFKTK